MSSDYGSLLALDSFASEESLRVAAYGRALTYLQHATAKASPEAVASRFVAFVGVERWRLDALDLAILRADRRMSVDRLMESAEKIVRWVQPEPVVIQTDPTPAPDGGGVEPEKDERLVVSKKKTTAKRRR